MAGIKEKDNILRLSSFLFTLCHVILGAFTEAPSGCQPTGTRPLSLHILTP